MRAVVCTAYGSHRDLVVADVDDPQPGPGQVLIDVHAASLNFPDLLMARGLYQFKPALPFVPGAEASGVISKIGEGVNDLSVGQRVASVGTDGAFAERRVVDASTIIRLPDEIDLPVAAAMTMTYATSYHALIQRAGIVAGETLLVLGASGGVGSAAVEFGKVLGATVIAAASTQDKLAFCSELGADHTINYTTEDVKTRLRELTEGSGVDVIFDPVGGSLSEAAFRAIAWNGRHLVIGFTAGDIPSIPLNLPLLKGGSIVGVFWGSFAAHEPDVAAVNNTAIAGMVAEGVLKPRITKTFRLEQIVEAIELLASRRATGKIVLQMTDTA